MKKEKLIEKSNRRMNDLNKFKRFGKVQANAQDAKSDRISIRISARNVTPTGGRFLNFRIIKKFSDGRISVWFADKQESIKVEENFIASSMFTDYDEQGNRLPFPTELTINLKNRPAVVIKRINRAEIRRRYANELRQYRMP